MFRYFKVGILSSFLLACGQESSFDEKVEEVKTSDATSDTSSGSTSDRGNSVITVSAGKDDEEQPDSSTNDNTSPSDSGSDMGGNSTDTGGNDTVGNNGSNNNEGSTSTTLPEITPEELKKMCDNQTRVPFTQKIVFAEPQDSCTWNANGNIAINDGVFTARREEYQSLNLPDKSLLCEMNLDFVTNNPNGQQMYYDDEIFVTFNNVILAASQSYNTYLAKNKDGFLVFDWKNMVGKQYNRFAFDQYCVGGGLGLGTCIIPPTETNGVMEINFEDIIIQKIAASTGLFLGTEGVDANKIKSLFNLGFVTTGDNDTSIDCKHSRFEIEVKGSYINLP